MITNGNQGIVDDIKNAKSPEAAATVLVRGLILRLGMALNEMDTAAVVRKLRDDLEKDTGAIASAMLEKTGDGRGPNDPDDSEVYPSGRDPLLRYSGTGTVGNQADGVGEGDPLVLDEEYEQPEYPEHLKQADGTDVAKDDRD